MRPILFSIGHLHFFAAPIFAGLSALLAAAYFWRFRERAGLSREDYWNLMALLAVFSIGGALFDYLALYGGGLLANLSWSLKHRDIRGGSFYGTVWGAAAGLALFARFRGKALPGMADLLGGASAIGLSLMRWGCFQHGCCFGKPTLSRLSVVFRDPRCAVDRGVLDFPVHPTQVYEALFCLLLFCFLHFRVYARVQAGRRPPGSVFIAFLVSYGVFRFFLEFIRGSDRGLFHHLGLSTAQWWSLATLAAAFALHRLWSRHESPA